LARVKWGYEMLVSAIGYFDSNSKSLYGLEQNKVQTKTNLQEGFGHIDDFMNASNRSSGIMSSLTSSFKTFLTPKIDDSKKYLNLIA